MKIKYQGKDENTDAATVAAFLETKGGVENAVVEYRGEVLDAAAFAGTPLEEGAELNLYRIVAGG